MNYKKTSDFFEMARSIFFTLLLCVIYQISLARPGAPTGIPATDITSTSFTANWGAGSGATGYLLDIATDNSYATKLSGYDNKDVGNTTSYVVTGLSPNTVYRFRVRSYNGAEMSGAYSSSMYVLTGPDGAQPPSPYTTVNPTSLLFSSSGGRKHVSVSSNTSWGISRIDGSYLSTSGGGSGNDRVAITLPERQWSPSGQVHNYEIGIGTAGLISISQEAPAAPYTNISPTDPSFGPDGGYTYLTMVSTNTNYGNVDFSPSEPWIFVSWDWLCHECPKIFITCAKNTITTPRSGTITASVDGIVTATITVSQAAGNPYVDISPTRVSFFSTGGSTNVSVSSNTNWVASTSDSWISVSGAGNGNGNITIACAENTSASTRIGTVSVSGGSNITVYQGRHMYVNINENLYPFADLITDSLQSIYHASNEIIKNLIRDNIYEQCENELGYEPENYRYLAPWPTELQPITFSQEGDGVYASLTFNNLRIHWDQPFFFRLFTTICKLESPTKDIPGWITMKVRIQLLREETKYFFSLDNISIDVSNFVFRSDDDAVELFRPGTVNDVNHMISEALDGMVQEMVTGFNLPVGDIAGNKFNGVTLTQDQANEIQAALPLSFSLGATSGCLSLNINILNQAGSRYFPTPSKFDYMGFVCPYYAFQTPILDCLSSPDPRAEQENIVINAMADYGAKTFRFSIPWKEVFPTIDLTKVQDPDVLTGSVLDDAIADIDESVWSNTDMVFQNGRLCGMEVIPQLFQQERDLPTIDEGTIAPDNHLTGLYTVIEDGKEKKYYYVNATAYLYYAKIFANAAVRRYKNTVPIWGAESEFNAARISSFGNVWRHGDCWAEDGAGGFQERYWRILIDAIRNNDPTAKIASNFHMLNLANGIDRLGPDLDIIGVDVYPDLNGQIAYPFMGYMVGEVVRATKSLLYSKRWTSKEVHVMETGYVGKDPDITSNDGGSVDECLKKFSYYRQAEYMKDAITSSSNYGAKGFFWWAFLDNEGSDGPEGELANFVSLMKMDGVTIKPAATAFKEKVPLFCAPLLLTPVAKSATDIKASSFTANWTAVSGVTAYYLDVATDANFFSFVSGYNNLNVGNTTSYSVTGLNHNGTFYYRVRSYFGAAGPNSNTISVTLIPAPFHATGGTITYANGYAIHTFTGSGALSCEGSGNVEVLVVAGGGGGGCHTGGGGGAGGVVYNASYSATGNINVFVGAGGNGSDHAGNGYDDFGVPGSNGSNSVFGSITAIGGGGGASRFINAGNGGSGGGGSPLNSGNSNSSGTSGQGYAGGRGGNAWPYLSGGGGGAGSVGSGGTGSGNGNGGTGLAFDISGSTAYYGGGGGGGVSGTETPGAGGNGGGGTGSNMYAVVGDGLPNTGGGGGGGGLSSFPSLPGGNGGSGVVIVRYPAPHAVGGTITYAGGNTIHTFTSSGTFSCLEPGNVKVLVVAGGGGGGCHTGGGGGAGGVVYNASYSVTSGDISVVVGAGGNGSTNNYIRGSNGSNSAFGSITAIGGGGGASRFIVAASGGSGGGGSPHYSGNSYGSGTSGQGYAGGRGGIAWPYLSGGGGGAGAIGSGGTGSGNGNGGTGLAFDISGSSVYYGGGGGGGVYGTDMPGVGGNGGGGEGSNTNGAVENGTPNTGGGGGGGGLTVGYAGLPGGNGGSGVVIVSYPTGGLFKGAQSNDRELAEAPVSIPTEYGLLQNYPNPFNPSTTIKYELPAAAYVTLKVYDMLGREVAVLQDGVKEAGYWTATFDASKLSSGVYFSRLFVRQDKGEMVSQVKKMLLVK